MKALENALIAARREAEANVKAAEKAAASSVKAARKELARIEKMVAGLGAGRPKAKRGRKAKAKAKGAGRPKGKVGRPKGKKATKKVAKVVKPKATKKVAKTDGAGRGRRPAADSLRGRVVSILESAGQPMAIGAIKDALAATGYDVSSDFMTAKITTCLNQAKAVRVARGVYAAPNYQAAAAPIATTETVVCGCESCETMPDESTVGS